VWQQRGNVTAFELDPAGGRPQHSSEKIDDGGLAGAVGPDQSVPRPRLDGEIDALRRQNAAEALFQSDSLQDRHRF